MRECDGIVIGAGHNGLILQAYAAMAGLDVISLERRDSAGGGLQTVEDPRLPGFRHNTHAFFHRAVDKMPWFRDLDLERHGCRYIEPDRNVVLLLRDGRTLEWWRDFDKTAASFARFSRRDADTLRRWRDGFAPILENILTPEAQSPPLPKPERERLLGASPEGRLLLETSRLSPLAFVQREFENPIVQAGLLFFNGLREVDLRAPGFGHHIPALLASPAKAQMAIGGARSLAQALERAVRSHGGDIRTSCEPKRIIVEGGRAVGVETADGEALRARRFVASSLNPQQTFLDLVAPEHLPADWRQAAANFRYNLLAPLFALNVSLREPPRYEGLDSGGLDDAFMVILGLEHIDQFPDIVRHHEAGSIPPTVMWGACPTAFDPSQAPAGGHTAFMWEKLPYRLGGDARNWDAAKRDHGQRMLETWGRYAPNLDGAVLDWFTRSPLDIERSFPNMREADLLVGAFTDGQTGHDRPFPGAGHYRGHLDGLYLCGSSCHPGGNITGLPGYNAAQVVLRDLGIEADWIPEPIARRLARL
jgi:phytoene dehydrogenase-like protein